ncbi:MAG: hypothetical protein DDT21_02753 [Syntrophomonadaceae bacterium]|nr:hypothetical protein [Bacillota bacterium]
MRLAFDSKGVAAVTPIPATVGAVVRAVLNCVPVGSVKVIVPPPIRLPAVTSLTSIILLRVVMPLAKPALMDGMTVAPVVGRRTSMPKSATRASTTEPLTRSAFKPLPRTVTTRSPSAAKRLTFKRMLERVKVVATVVAGVIVRLSFLGLAVSIAV